MDNDLQIKYPNSTEKVRKCVNEKSACLIRERKNQITEHVVTNPDIRPGLYRVSHCSFCFI